MTAESKEEYWRRIVKEFECSGKSRRKFCEERDLVKSQLIYWNEKYGSKRAGSSVVNGNGAKFVELVKPTGRQTDVGRQLDSADVVRRAGTSAELIFADGSVLRVMGWSHD